MTVHHNHWQCIRHCTKVRSSTTSVALHKLCRQCSVHHGVVRHLTLWGNTAICMNDQQQPGMPHYFYSSQQFRWLLTAPTMGGTWRQKDADLAARAAGPADSDTARWVACEPWTATDPPRQRLGKGTATTAATAASSSKVPLGCRVNTLP